LSLKENVEMVKEELNSEEKFFEKAVMTERFITKYKKPLIAAFVAVVLVAFGNVAYKMKEQNRLNEANAQLAILMQDPANTKAASELQNLSPKLYNLWSYSNAVKKGDTSTLETLKTKNLLVISDLAMYEYAQRKNDKNELQTYTNKQDAIYQDLAVVEVAVTDIKENKVAQAKQKLTTISQNSPLKEVALTLEHYGVK